MEWSDSIHSISIALLVVRPVRPNHQRKAIAFLSKNKNTIATMQLYKPNGAILLGCFILIASCLEITQAFSHTFCGTSTRDLLRCRSLPSSAFDCDDDDTRDNANLVVEPAKKVKGIKRIPTEPEVSDLSDEIRSTKSKANGIKKSGKGGTTKKKKKARRKKKVEISYWLDESDALELEFESANSNSTQGASKLRFKVRGNPRPLRRHRTSFGRMYNPSEGLQNSFRDVVRRLIFSGSDLEEPLFGGDETLVMTIIFRLKRPKKDFIGGKPGPDRMRPTAPSQTAQTRTDVDNLVKFVFDSMNTILYEDDRQIMSVHVVKVLDNEGMCEGSTEVLLQSITDDDVESLMENSFAIAQQRHDS